MAATAQGQTFIMFSKLYDLVIEWACIFHAEWSPLAKFQFFVRLYFLYFRFRELIKEEPVILSARYAVSNKTQTLRVIRRLRRDVFRDNLRPREKRATKAVSGLADCYF